jgi:hypothetical protein
LDHCWSCRIFLHYIRGDRVSVKTFKAMAIANHNQYSRMEGIVIVSTTVNVVATKDE